MGGEEGGLSDESSVPPASFRAQLAAAATLSPATVSMDTVLSHWIQPGRSCPAAYLPSTPEACLQDPTDILAIVCDKPAPGALLPFIPSPPFSRFMMQFNCLFKLKVIGRLYDLITRLSFLAMKTMKTTLGRRKGYYKCC